MSEVIAPGAGDNSAVIDVARWSTKQESTPEPSQAESVPANESEPVEAAVAQPQAVEQKPEENKEPEVRPSRDWRIDEYYRLKALERQYAESAPKPAEQSKPAPVATDLTEPKWDAEKYADKGGYDAFVKDLAEYAGERRFLELQRAQAEQAAQAQAQQRQASFAQRIAAANIPDFQQVLQAATQPVQNAEVLQAIIESDQGPQLAYHLAKTPDDVIRLNSLPIRSQLIELGKLEARFAQSTPIQNQQPTGVSKAPPPVQPLRPKAAAVKNDPAALLVDGSNFREVAQASGWQVQRGRWGRNR